LALKNIVRNRRSGVSLAIGIFLSLLLFNALNFNINIAQDEIIQSTVTEGYEIIGNAYYYRDEQMDQRNIANDTDTWNDIESEPEIQSITPLAFTNVFDYTSKSDFNIFGIREPDWTSILESPNSRIIVGTGNFSDFNYSTAHIPVVGFATSPRIENDSLLIRDYERNYTLDILGWVTFDVTDTVFEDRIGPWMQENPQIFVFITLMPNITSFGDFDVQLNIKVISSIINYKNIQGTANKLNSIVDRLNLKYRDYWFYSPISSQLLGAQLFIFIFLVITLIFLLPFFFLAFYISRLSSDLNLESRRIQYGLFLTRGIDARTIQRSYLTEGVILGLINGIITFLLTPVFGLILADYLPVNIPQEPLHAIAVNFYFENIVLLGWSVLIGMAVGFFIMRLPHFYVRLSPYELMHQYRFEEGETTRTRGRRDLIFLLLGLYPIATVLMLYLATILQVPSIFFIMFSFMGSYALYIAPFSPFLISYGLSSFLARQPLILSSIANFYSKLFPGLKGLTERMIFSKLYRISRIAFVMALALTFIIFPLILSASLETYNTKLGDFNRGGDVRIDVYSNSSLKLDSLKQRPEVAAASLIHIEYENILTIVYMNSSEFASSANISPFWRLKQEALLSLDESSILVSTSTIKDLGLNPDDTLTINSTEYKIAGSFKALGGTGIIIGGTHLVIINKQLNPTVTAGRFILKLTQLSAESGRSLYDFVSETDPDANFNAKIEVRTLEEKQPSFDIFVFLVRILETQAVLLTFIAIFALAFLMIIRVRERTREFGTWRSKGMSNTQLLQGLVIETASIGTLGLLVGIITGTIMVLGFQGFILNTIIEGASLIPVDIIIPLEMWFLLFLMISGIIIMAILVGMWVLMTPISKQIRYEDYT
jgi:ABC-type lipoprotein release transport system permease subunit